nr:reverse transcriptase domain-containing protein [Tanacetum cinerariifolium]
MKKLKRSCKFDNTCKLREIEKEITPTIDLVAYKRELPEELSNVHNTFHVSNLKNYLSDESLIIPMKELKLDDKLNFVEEPVEIMDREIKQLRQSRAKCGRHKTHIDTSIKQDSSIAVVWKEGTRKDVKVWHWTFPLEMSLGSTLKACKFLTSPSAPLVVIVIGICSTSTVTGKMANSVALVVLGNTWTIMVIVTFGTQSKGADLLVYQLSCKFNCILHGLWLSTHQCQFLKTLVIAYHIDTFNLQGPHLNLQLLNIAPWASTSKKSTSGKLDLVFHSAVAYTEHSFHHFKPQSQLDNSLRGSCLLTPVPESWLSSPFRLLSASRAANASPTPWLISVLSWALVIRVVVVVFVVAGVDLVVLFGAIFFNHKKI